LNAEAEQSDLASGDALSVCAFTRPINARLSAPLNFARVYGFIPAAIDSYRSDA
jgi:hypothetical protein